MIFVVSHLYRCLIEQASKKAASKRKNAQRASSNVFAMFEQSQIQEFKEVNVKYQAH